MPKLNPFAKVNCQYGAPMGRHGHDPSMWDREGKLYARHCGGDGYYDRGGAYWGHGDVYAVWTRGGDFCAYVDGIGSASMAIAKVYRLSAPHDSSDAASNDSAPHMPRGLID